MTIDELIAHLQQRRGAHGNMPVVIIDNRGMGRDVVDSAVQPAQSNLLDYNNPYENWPDRLVLEVF